ncbi:MAG: HAMP domain-containing sensor histidine kinase [bacterium]|nr:HAMP domain-containing sensor histidine kinase [bacterium]
MLKIFDENWLAQATRTSWKRFAGSATAFADRYLYDPFLRTQINVVGMLTLFSIFLLTLASILINYLYHDISLAVVNGVRASILASSTAPIADTIPSLDEIRSQNISAIVAGTVSATIAFGYLLTRAALGPTRHALASQKQFIGNIAHELRTPLAVIKTNTEVALFSEEIPDATRAIMNSNIEEIDRASEIINNLLSLSASVRPERIEFSAVDAAAIATDVIEKLEHLARVRNLDVTLRKGNTAYVWGNPFALEQVMMNVVKNAINYTSRSGHISVTVEQIGDSRVEIIVQDSGLGIARHDLFHIFEPFYRAEQSRNRSYGGSGLGLAIVSELVKLHRGKITVRSAVGRGTTVSISLPSAPTPASDHTIKHRKTLDEVAVDYSHRRI